MCLCPLIYRLVVIGFPSSNNKQLPCNEKQLARNDLCMTTPFFFSLHNSHTQKRAAQVDFIVLFFCDSCLSSVSMRITVPVWCLTTTANTPAYSQTWRMCAVCVMMPLSELDVTSAPDVPSACRWQEQGAYRCRDRQDV